jgi:hypothetical protein
MSSGVPLFLSHSLVLSHRENIYIHPQKKSFFQVKFVDTSVHFVLLETDPLEAITDMLVTGSSTLLQSIE